MQKQIQQLSTAVADLSKFIRSQEPVQTALRLPSQSLPEFTSAENIDRFSEQLTQVLQSTQVNPRNGYHVSNNSAKKIHVPSTSSAPLDMPKLKKYPTRHQMTSFKPCIQAVSHCLQHGVPKDQ